MSALVGVYLFLVELIQLMFQFVDNILDIVVHNFVLILQVPPWQDADLMKKHFFLM